MTSIIRQVLSSLKSRVISRDLQDIYLFTDRQRKEILAVPLDKIGSQSQKADISFEVYDNPEVLELIEAIHPQNDQGRRFVLDRLSAGDKAIIGFDADQPVFYGWLMFDEIEMTYGVFMGVPRGIVFGYNLFTKETHRRRGAMTGFYKAARQYMKDHQFHTLYIGISTKNRTSIKAHLKNGFEKIGYFYTVKLFGKCFTLARFEHAKRFHIN